MEIEIEVFQLTEPLRAVQFDFDGKGVCSLLPAEATVRILGRSTIPGCLMVAYDEQHYNIFKEDLRRYSNARRGVMAAHAKAG